MKEELLSYGLSEKEADLYLALLRSGDSTTNKIVKSTQVSRTSIYDVAESLEKKGLISTYRKDKKIFFSANKPEALLTRLQEKEQLIKNILPDLKKIQETTGERPTITIYKGTVGLKTAANEMLNSKEILVYGGGKTADIIFGSYTANFAQKRAERKILLKAIGCDIPEHMNIPNIKKYTQTKSLPLFNNHNTTYFIYNDTVLLWIYGKELLAMKIESNIFSMSQRQLFNFLWTQAK